MTQGVDLRSLLERVQKAQGPDRELDIALDALVFSILPHGSGVEKVIANTPYYTHSIDASVGLVSKLLPGHVVDIHINHAESYYGSQIVNHTAVPFVRVTDNSADSAALSVLNCLVQALIAKAEAEEGVGEF